MTQFWKSMRLSILPATCFGAAMLLGLPAMAQNAAGSDLARFAVDWIESEQEEARIPGVITALVVDGEVALAQGFGDADVDAHIAVDANTRFRVGSISKPVTATTALMAMAEFGIAPEDDLRSYLIDLAIRPTLHTPLTLHDLLTHSAGFSESLSGQHVTDPLALLELSEYLQERLPPRFEEPGRIITYNDHHTALVGYVIEQLAQEAFSDYAQRRVFDRLEMARSTFDQNDIVVNELTPLARSYWVSEDSFMPYEHDFIMTTPAAGLATTAADMGQYLAYLLTPSEDNTLLPEALSTRQVTVQFENDPRLRGRAYGFVESTRGGYLVLYKDGQANGFGARLLIVPELGLGVFVAINRSVLGHMGGPNEASRFLRAYTSAVLDEAIASSETANNVPNILEGVDSRAFEGTYRTTVAARHTWEKLLAVTDTAHVAAMPDGSIMVGNGHYVPVDEGIFQWHEGGPYFVGFEASDNDPARYLLIGSGSYERVPWYGVMDGAAKIVGGVAATALIMLIAGGILWRRGHFAPWAGFALVGSAGRLVFVAILAATLFLMDPQVLFYGMPFGLRVAVGVALGALVFDGLAFISFARGGGRGLISVGIVTFYFASSAIFAWWLSYWNLLGWQMG